MICVNNEDKSDFQKPPKLYYVHAHLVEALTSREPSLTSDFTMMITVAHVAFDIQEYSIIMSNFHNYLLLSSYLT